MNDSTDLLASLIMVGILVFAFALIGYLLTIFTWAILAGVKRDVIPLTPRRIKCGAFGMSAAAVVAIFPSLIVVWSAQSSNNNPWLLCFALVACGAFGALGGAFIAGPQSR